MKSKKETETEAKTANKKAIDIDALLLSEADMATETKTTKKFFPKDAKPSAPPTGAIAPKVAAKRTPWMKKPIENPHASPAGPCYSLREQFDNYVTKTYKRLKEEQRHAAWKIVSMQLVEAPTSNLKELIDAHFSKK